MRIAVSGMTNAARGKRGSGAHKWVAGGPPSSTPSRHTAALERDYPCKGRGTPSDHHRMIGIPSEYHREYHRATTGKHWTPPDERRTTPEKSRVCKPQNSSTHPRHHFGHRARSVKLQKRSPRLGTGDIHLHHNSIPHQPEEASGATHTRKL